MICLSDCAPPLLLLAMCALSAAQMNERHMHRLMGLQGRQHLQGRQQDRLYRVLPQHEQPRFEFDDGGDHEPARTSDHYCRLFSGHSLCRVPHTRQSCGFVRRRRLSFQESAAILHRHNMERMMLAQGQVRGRNGGRLPSGSNIMQLVSGGAQRHIPRGKGYMHVMVLTGR